MRYLSLYYPTISILITLILAYRCSGNEMPRKSGQLDDKTIEMIRTAENFKALFETDTVKLSFPADIAIGEISDLHITRDNKIVISDLFYAKVILLFDSTGQFLAKIGKQGQGPGEYQSGWYVSSNARQEIIVADRTPRRIMFFDRSGNYSRSFTVNHPVGHILVSPQNRIIIDDRIGIDVKKTIWVYTDEGKLLANFGKLSKATETISKHIPFMPKGPFVAIDSGAFFESDYADYHIRKYWDMGRSGIEFGEEPAEWQSLLGTNYQTLGGGSSYGDLDSYLRNEFHKCSRLVWMHIIKPGILATLVWNGYERDNEKYFLHYDFYTTDDKLIRQGLRVLGFPAPKGALRTHYKLSAPDKFCFVQYIDSKEDINEEIRIIVFRLKSFDASKSNNGKQ